jgi:hypothetical protein
MERSPAAFASETSRSTERREAVKVKGNHNFRRLPSETPEDVRIHNVRAKKPHAVLRLYDHDAITWHIVAPVPDSKFPVPISGVFADPDQAWADAEKRLKC